MKITAVRHSQPYHYRMERRIGDANGPVGSDRGGGMLLYVDTDWPTPSPPGSGAPSAWSDSGALTRKVRGAGR
jgi:hypothetical protein